MGNIAYTDGTGIPPRSFDDEFLTHKGCAEWWYCTGYLEEGSGNLFAYQFTLARIRLFGINLKLLICSVTDFQTGRHYNIQVPMLFSKKLLTNAHAIAIGSNVSVEFAPNSYSSKGRMHLVMKTGQFSLDVHMEATKPPVWHCDNGVLQMGIPDEKQRTYYYSFTNLATAGSLILEGVSHPCLTGKAWFDRQGGTCTLTDPRTNWEWFSLRFFDNVEVMLFAFPQDPYYDGTYIEADGLYRRLNDYKLEATSVTTCAGRQFSCRWSLEMEGRRYDIVPKMDGMFNVFFFELLADVIDEKGEVAGFCFVEILPGVRNKLSSLDAFKRK